MKSKQLHTSIRQLILFGMTMSAVFFTGCAGTLTQPANVATGSAETLPPPTSQVSVTVPQSQVSSETGTNATAGNYTLADISKHNSPSDCWMAIDGQVYDVTEYIASGAHNGVINEACGLEASAMFKQQEKHSEPKAQNQLPRYEIGQLK